MHHVTALFKTRRGTPYNDLQGEPAPPERGTIFRLQFYEGVGISLVEVYERVGKSVSVWSVKRPKRANRRILWL